MSHMVTRKGPVGDDKEKRQTDSPVKEMKKKIAANAEKEKQAAEKSTDKSEKTTEKSAEKKDKADKQTDKPEKKDKGEKHGEKSSEKKEKHVEKVAEKKDKRDKSAEKAVEKPAEKKDKSSEKATDKKEKDKKDVPEKSKDEASSAEKSAKQPEKPEEPKTRKPETVKLNGGTQNGTSANGAGSSSDDDELIIVEQPEDNDEMFPELAYDDNSDADGFEPDTAATRSLTRRSQVKATRTPETPRPASAAHAPKDIDHSKEPKVLRLKEDAALTDRRLRSAGSPKPTGKDSPKKTDSPSKGEVASKDVTSRGEVASKGDVASKDVMIGEVASKDVTKDDVASKDVTSKGDVASKDVTSKGEVASKDVTSKGDVASDSDVVILSMGSALEPEEKTEKSEMEVTIEVENSEDGDATRRDTRYSRSRVKVSPYRRSARLADTHTSFASVASHTSLMANYTGNNTTMETDITETSMVEDSPSPSPGPDDSYLAGLRAIRGRRSYKVHANTNPNPHVQMAYARASANSAANVSAGRDARPTGTVVGRKRRPDAALEASAAEEIEEAPKRARLLDRLARPFRTHSTPLPARRAAEIVGINTDLPLTAPVAASEAFDPETIKPTPEPTPNTLPTPTRAHDSKRCAIM